MAEQQDQLRDYEKSLALIERSLAKMPESPIVNYHAGMVLYQLGRTGEAKEKLEKAVGSEETFIGREEAERTLKMIS